MLEIPLDDIPGIYELLPPATSPATQAFNICVGITTKKIGLSDIPRNPAWPPPGFSGKKQVSEPQTLYCKSELLSDVLRAPNWQPLLVVDAAWQAPSCVMMTPHCGTNASIDIPRAQGWQSA